MTVVTTTPAIDEKKQKQGERIVAEDEIIVPPAPAVDEIDIVDPSSKAGVVEVATEAESHFPSVCYCPITKRIMVDPVVGPSGTSFERDAVLEQQNDGELISYYPNRALRAYIEILHQMNDDEGSVRGTLRKLDTNIRTNWDRFVEKAQLPLGQSRPLPDEFYCILTLDLPHEPVIDPDGYTFEQAAIVHWIQSNADSPVTRKPLAVDQLRHNDAVLSILLQESEKPDDAIHPCIQRWKDELLAPPPSIVPPSSPNTFSSPGIVQGIVTLNGTTGSPTTHVIVYPTTHEEMEERRRREHRASMITLFLVLVIISFALIYLPFYLVVLALAFASCLYARRKFHERHPRRRLTFQSSFHSA